MHAPNNHCVLTNEHLMHYRDIPDTHILRMLVRCGSQAIVAPVSIKFAPMQRWYIYLSSIDILRIHQTEGIHRSMSWLCCFLLPMSFTVEKHLVRSTQGERGVDLRRDDTMRHEGQCKIPLSSPSVGCLKCSIRAFCLVS